ncbi:hypothetical protein Hanom_Chr07g00668391 [Helianthus anomalus]
MDLIWENYLNVTSSTKIIKMSPFCVVGRTPATWDVSVCQLEESMNDEFTRVRQR